MNDCHEYLIDICAHVFCFRAREVNRTVQLAGAVDSCLLPRHHPDMGVSGAEERAHEGDPRHRLDTRHHGNDDQQVRDKNIYLFIHVCQ